MDAILKQFESFFPPSHTVSEMVSTSKLPAHPYYPEEVEILGYQGNEWNTLELLSMFGGGCAVIFSATYILLKRVRPNISTTDLSTVLWFVLCTDSLCASLF